MEFLTSKELSLNPANYLINTKTGKPVTHEAFIKQQRDAEYIVKLAAAISGKTFTHGKLDNLEAIKAEVRASMTSTKVNYVDAPEKPVSKVNDELVKFALDFASFEGEKEKANKINEFMNQFNDIKSIEEIGDYFSESVVKLAKIYTVAEILAAVRVHVEKLK